MKANNQKCDPSAVLFFFTIVLISLESCAPLPPATTTGFKNNRFFVNEKDYPYSVGNSQLKICVPQGFVTDWASIPRPFWSIYSPHDSYSRAAMVHDYLYWAQPCSKTQADNLFTIAMKESGVSGWDRFWISVGLWWGGDEAWEENKGEKAKDWPKVIPKEYLDFDGTWSWPDFRKYLVDNHVRDPEFPQNPAYCELGNSDEIPESESQ